MSNPNRARILCPSCGELGRTHITDSRQTTRDGRSLRWRRRQCVLCDHRWSTVEIPSDDYEALVKLARATQSFSEALEEATVRS